MCLPLIMMCLPRNNSTRGFLHALLTYQHQVRSLYQSGTPGHTREMVQRLLDVAVAAVLVVLAVCAAV